MSALSKEAILDTCHAFLTLRDFPRDETAWVFLGELLEDVCASEDELDALRCHIIEHWDFWLGPASLRKAASRLACRRREDAAASLPRPPLRIDCRLCSDTGIVDGDRCSCEFGESLDDRFVALCRQSAERQRQMTRRAATRQAAEAEVAAISSQMREAQERKRLRELDSHWSADEKGGFGA